MESTEEKDHEGRNGSMRRVSCYQFNPETDVIGKGVYGEVYKAVFVKPFNGTDTLEGENALVALKRTLCASKEEGMPASTIREVMVLRELNKKIQAGSEEQMPKDVGRENVVKLYDVIMENNMIYVATEFCDAGDLAFYLSKQPRRRLSNRDQYRQWMRDILRGIYFLHSKEFSHRDLKPQNVVLKTIQRVKNPSSDPSCCEKGELETGEAEYIIKITDFGLSRVEGIPVKKYQHEAITLWYRSPDVLLGNTNYSYTADLWSAGCIIAESASGNAIFRGRNDKEQLSCIFARLGPPTEQNFPSMKQYAHYEKLSSAVDLRERGGNNNDSRLLHSSDVYESARRNLYSYFKKYEVLGVVGADGVDLLSRLLAYEPKNRLTAEEALQHPFFFSLSQSISISSKQQLPVLATGNNVSTTVTTASTNANTKANSITTEVTEKQSSDASSEKTGGIRLRTRGLPTRALSRRCVHSYSFGTTAEREKVKEHEAKLAHFDGQAKIGSGSPTRIFHQASLSVTEKSTHTNGTGKIAKESAGGPRLRNTSKMATTRYSNDSVPRDITGWSNARKPLCGGQKALSKEGVGGSFAQGSKPSENE